MAVRVRIDLPRARFVSTHAGQAYMERVLQEIYQRAVARAGGTYSTGALQASIEIQGPAIRGDQVRGAVGSRSDHAMIAHDGASVHEIFPKAWGSRTYRFGTRRRPQLKFYWRKAGRVVYFPQIPGSPSKIGHSHPGYAGKKYLSIPLVEVGRRYGLKITLRDV